MLPVAPGTQGDPLTPVGNWNRMLGGYGVNSDGGARILGSAGSALTPYPHRFVHSRSRASSRLAAESAQDAETQGSRYALTPHVRQRPRGQALPATCRKPCGYAVSVHPMWVILILVSPSFRPVVESVPCTCRSRCGSRPRTGPWRSLGFGPNAACAQRPPSRLRPRAPPSPLVRPILSPSACATASPSSFGPPSLPLRAGPTPEHCPRLVLSITCPAGLISWGPRSHFGSRLLRLRCGDLILAARPA
jgi:hypothetical protein